MKKSWLIGIVAVVVLIIVITISTNNTNITGETIYSDVEVDGIKCEDTDNSNEDGSARSTAETIYEKGTTTRTVESTGKVYIKEDECYGNLRIKERFCWPSGSIKTTDIPCPSEHICRDGACVPKA
jgi:uncharacterized protein YxeA